MDEKARRSLEITKTLTPFNIRNRTDAPESLQISFMDMWSRHGAEAARLSILPYIYDGRVMVLK